MSVVSPAITLLNNATAATDGYYATVAAVVNESSASHHRSGLTYSERNRVLLVVLYRGEGERTYGEYDCVFAVGKCLAWVAVKFVPVLTILAVECLTVEENIYSECWRNVILFLEDVLIEKSRFCLT